jgi:2-haloacid dehalogenase
VSTTAAKPPEVVVLDLGGVLIDWNPRYLFRKLIADESEMETFLAQVCNQDWNVHQDAGRPFSEAVVELAARHPDSRALIEAYWERWPEMLGGAIEETVTVLEELATRRVPLYALSNWSAETWPHARRRFAFLDHFDGLVISGFEGTAKPEAEIFRRLLERYALPAERTLFFDDVEANVAAARRVGMQAYHHLDAAGLRCRLRAFGLL